MGSALLEFRRKQAAERPRAPVYVNRFRFGRHRDDPAPEEEAKDTIEIAAAKKEGKVYDAPKCDALTFKGNDFGEDVLELGADDFNFDVVQQQTAIFESIQSEEAARMELRGRSLLQSGYPWRSEIVEDGRRDEPNLYHEMPGDSEAGDIRSPEYANELTDDFVNLIFLGSHLPYYIDDVLNDLKKVSPHNNWPRDYNSWGAYAYFLEQLLVSTRGAIINADGIEAVRRSL